MTVRRARAPAKSPKADAPGACTTTTSTWTCFPPFRMPIPHRRPRSSSRTATYGTGRNPTRWPTSSGSAPSAPSSSRKNAPYWPVRTARSTRCPITAYAPHSTASYKSSSDTETSTSPTTSTTAPRPASSRPSPARDTRAKRTSSTRP
nr:hypothetical protein PDK3.059 [Rhodococcus sp. DK17]